jgi:hypothetical protein
VLCVWHGSASGCSSSGCGCVGGADSVGGLNPFWENVRQNSFFWMCDIDKRVKYPQYPSLFSFFLPFIFLFSFPIYLKLVGVIKKAACSFGCWLMAGADLL